MPFYGPFGGWTEELASWGWLIVESLVCSCLAASVWSEEVGRELWIAACVVASYRSHCLGFGHWL